MNDKLKNEKEFEIIENDIFYKEGVLEFLEENNDIDILILYEKLSGEIDLITLIKNIKKINYKINIFFILENKDENLEKLLKRENIKNIIYINEININDFVNKLKNLKINNNKNLEEEIKLLKNIIIKKDKELLVYKNNFNNFENKNKAKVIIICGIEKSGKSLILNNLKNIVENKSEFDFQEMDIKNFSEISKLNIYKIIFVLEINYEKIKLNKKIINKLIKENNIKKEKINIIFNKINKYSINKKLAKNIFKKFKIIGNIKLNNYPDFIFNQKNNYKKENKKLVSKYLKIIKKL